MYIDLDSFDQPIGSGMAGTVYSSSTYPYLVLKRMNGDICTVAEKEYKISQDMYNAYRLYILCGQEGGIVQVPEYLSFTEQDRGCALLMERVPATQDDALWHLSLSDAIREKDRYYGPRGATDIGRGYFPSENSLQHLLGEKGWDLRIDDLVEAIGLLDGIALFGASILPQDVEYVLAGDGKVYALDFGLAEKVEQDEIVPLYTDILDTSIYYTPEPEYVASFLSGLRKAYTCFSSQVPPGIMGELEDALRSMAE